MADARLEKLRSILGEYRSCLIAYSGGVDSVLLAKVAHDVLGDRSLAVIADSPSLPRAELKEAVALGKQFGFPVHIIHTSEFENQDYIANPVNRCYYCKHELFRELEPLARERRFAVIAYGENASDVGDHRPGATAAQSYHVKAPLKEAGLSKQDIRELSGILGLPTADKPQMACLSSRIPYGEVVSTTKLSMIEAAEAFLRDQGFREVRVRHHELAGGGGDDKKGHLARIELAPADITHLLSDEDQLERIERALREVGYRHVTLDLAGYRRGSLNESIVTGTEAAGVHR